VLEELPVLEAKGCPWPPTLQGLPLQSLHRLLRHLVNLRVRIRGPGDPGISPGDPRTRPRVRGGSVGSGNPSGKEKLLMTVGLRPSRIGPYKFEASGLVQLHANL